MSQYVFYILASGSTIIISAFNSNTMFNKIYLKDTEKNKVSTMIVQLRTQVMWMKRCCLYAFFRPDDLTYNDGAIISLAIYTHRLFFYRPFCHYTKCKRLKCTVLTWSSLAFASIIYFYYCCHYFDFYFKPVDFITSEKPWQIEKKKHTTELNLKYITQYKCKYFMHFLLWIMSCCYPTGQAVHILCCTTFTVVSRTISTSKILNAAVFILLNDSKCFLLLLWISRIAFSEQAKRFNSDLSTKKNGEVPK